MTPLLIPVFCNQHQITGQSSASLPTYEELYQTITNYLSFTKKRSDLQIAFYGGTFLGLSDSDLLSLLDMATDLLQKFHLNGIRFSTRPDTITAEKLHLISPYPIRMVEIGAQSMDDEVLTLSGRGHSAKDTKDAVALLKKVALPIGIQFMLGLPGDTPQKALSSGIQIAQLQPDAVRIYPTLVLKESPLAKQIEGNRYAPFSLEGCVEITGKLLRVFTEKNITILRMGLPASEEINPVEIITGPWHPAFGDLAWTCFYKNLLLEKLSEFDFLPEQVTIFTHPKHLSQVRGHANQNLKTLLRHYPHTSFFIKSDASLSDKKPELQIQI